MIGKCIIGGCRGYCDMLPLTIWTLALRRIESTLLNMGIRYKESMILALRLRNLRLLPRSLPKILPL